MLPALPRGHWNATNLRAFGCEQMSVVGALAPALLLILLPPLLSAAESAVLVTVVNDLSELLECSPSLLKMRHDVIVKLEFPPDLR